MAATPATRKHLLEIPLLGALVGTILGGLIGFASSWFVTQSQIHHSDHETLIAARRVVYEAFTGDMKRLSLAMSDLQSAVNDNPQGSDAVEKSSIVSEQANLLVTDYANIQIDGSATARSLADKALTVFHRDILTLSNSATDPAAYQKTVDTIDQYIRNFESLARREIGANAS